MPRVGWRGVTAAGFGAAAVITGVPGFIGTGALIIGAASVTTGAAGVAGAADTGTLEREGRPRGVTAVCDAAIGLLLVRSGELGDTKCAAVATASPATTTVSADSPMICLDRDCVPGAWNTSGPARSQAVCWSSGCAFAVVG
ncbi:MAG: hypothetical protein DLM60_21885 [Pseudonocardiales bacterium]|nr:MAG: hypothetical protein DLM60_21885 [Pseudonocardiales bacterium]